MLYHGRDDGDGDTNTMGMGMGIYERDENMRGKKTGMYFEFLDILLSFFVCLGMGFFLSAIAAGDAFLDDDGG